jgi:hypothetical protein
MPIDGGRPELRGARLLSGARAAQATDKSASVIKYKEADGSLADFKQVRAVRPSPSPLAPPSASAARRGSSSRRRRSGRRGYPPPTRLAAPPRRCTCAAAH